MFIFTYNIWYMNIYAYTCIFIYIFKPYIFQKEIGMDSMRLCHFEMITWIEPKTAQSSPSHRKFFSMNIGIERYHWYIRVYIRSMCFVLDICLVYRGMYIMLYIWSYIHIVTYPWCIFGISLAFGSSDLLPFILSGRLAAIALANLIHLVLHLRIVQLFTDFHHFHHGLMVLIDGNIWRCPESGAYP